MSEFEKENIPDLSENGESVEAFDEFEMNIEDAGEVEDSEEVEEIEDSEEAEETEDSEEAEEVEDSEEVEEVEDSEEVEEVEDSEEVEEVEDSEEVEEVEDSEEIEEAEEAEEAEEIEDSEEAEEIEAAEEEPLELIGNPDELEEISSISAAYAALNAMKMNDAEDDDEYYGDEDSDEGTSRSKKSVSGKAAVITMLLTLLVTVGLIVTAFWLGFTMQKDMGISVVSYADKFNACDFRDNHIGQAFNIELVSFSDEEFVLSRDEINDMKHSKTISKFNDLVSITTNSRFGQIVSMDIEFDEKIDELDAPQAESILLLGYILSGIVDDVKNGDIAFYVGYYTQYYSYPAPDKGENIRVSFYNNGIAVYLDFSQFMQTNKLSDIKIHIEAQDTKILDPDKLDFSWIPFDFSSKDNGDNSSDGQQIDSQNDKQEEIISGSDKD